MKQFVSHKIVEAAEIVSFDVAANNLLIKSENPDFQGGEVIEVPAYLFLKCQVEGRFPQEGDFLVKYPGSTPNEPDYYSWSPRDKFLSGYSEYNPQVPPQ